MVKKPGCIFWHKGSSTQTHLAMHPNLFQLFFTPINKQRTENMDNGSETLSMVFLFIAPLVFSTSGAMGREVTTFYKRLVNHLSDKQNKVYSLVMGCTDWDAVTLLPYCAVVCKEAVFYPPLGLLWSGPSSTQGQSLNGLNLLDCTWIILCMYVYLWFSMLCIVAAYLSSLCVLFFSSYIFRSSVQKLKWLIC